MSNSQLGKTGDAWIVCRSFRLTRPVSQTEATNIRENLSAIEGVTGMEITEGAKDLKLTYNASRTNYQALARRLGELGCPLASNAWSRIKGWLYQYSDTNARDNAKAPPPPCCNKPPR